MFRNLAVISKQNRSLYLKTAKHIAKNKLFDIQQVNKQNFWAYISEKSLLNLRKNKFIKLFSGIFETIFLFQQILFEFFELFFS